MLLIFPICIFTALTSGCYYELEVPDQNQFKSVDEIAESDQAVARVYAATLPGLGALAIHSWVLVKSADSHEFDRWEIWPDFWNGTSIIHKNWRTPEKHFGLIYYVVAETVGEQAQAVKNVADSCEETYPYTAYDLLCGPNCNTFTQWIADQAGWDIDMPDAAWGKDY
jgi:hypothetical protein